MACKVNHSTLKNVKFCEACGEKVVQSHWTCQNNHQVEMKYDFCLSCGTDKKFQITGGRNSIQPRTTMKRANSVDQLNSEVNNPYASNFNSPSSNKQNLIIMIVVFALIGLVALAGVVNNATKVKTTTVTVTQTLVDQYCYDISWGYGDIPGAQVVLSADGVNVGYGSYSSVGSTTALGCQFTAYIYDVPMNAESYAVELASGRRGVVYNSREDMISNDWNIYLTLGS